MSIHDGDTDPLGSDHPDDSALSGWLETGRPARVGRHVETCERCVDRLDRLSDLGGSVRAGLDSVTSPPVDLEGRTTGRVHRRLVAQESMSLLIEMFTLPWRTLDAVIDGSRHRRVAPSGGADSHDANDDGERLDG
ncbi:MAG: hypothetical protein JJE52_15055 [Acidimicrobiia bacterium]|nr:hypothetical protein [Acidimicrobiia bacterium]